MPYVLQDYQQESMLERATIWRWTETSGVNGKPGGGWGIVDTAVPVHLNQRPSQFELQAAQEAGILEEGDNIFTLDKFSFPAAAPVEAGDVVKLTTAHALLQGGFWKVRGDLQARTWMAGKIVFIAARIELPPDGVS